MSTGLELIGRRQIRVSHNLSFIVGLVAIWLLWSLLFSESPFLSIAVILVTFLAITLLWRPGEPPTLMLLVAIHLLQVSAALLHANVLGVNVNEMGEWPGIDRVYATWVALGAVFCLILGMHFGQAGPAIWPPSLAKAEASAWSPKLAFVFFLITAALNTLFTRLSEFSESMRQIFLAVAGIQWIGVFLLTYVCLSQKRGLGYVSVAVSIEVVLGFLGFFGDFRQVFFALFVAIASARPRLRTGSIALTIVVVAVALVLGAFWSAIKTNYRQFLNEHTESQAVLVPVQDRLSYLATQVESADMDTLSNGFNELWSRIAYIDFFGATLRNVPTNVPHEDGILTNTAITHFLVPRLVYPDKPALPSDTVVTARYTGLPLVARADTTISIGYPGEFYIDFGTKGLFVCMGILGFCYGKATRIVLKSFKSPLVAYGATIPLLMPGFMFETALPKVLGGFVMSFIVLLLLSKTLVPFLENRFLSTVRSKTAG
jgi:hypothetical protein